MPARFSIRRARFPKLELELREEKTPRLLAPLGHRLARGKSATLGEAELAGEDVLLLEDGHRLRNQALRICATAGAHSSERVRATRATPCACDAPLQRRADRAENEGR